MLPERANMQCSSLSWREHCLYPAGSDIQVASWLDGGSSSKIAGLALNTAVAGEPLEVLVSITNPLALDLSVSRIRLDFEAEPGGSTEAAAALAEAAASEAAPEAFAEVTCPVCPAPYDSEDAPYECTVLGRGKDPPCYIMADECLGTCGKIALGFMCAGGGVCCDAEAARVRVGGAEAAAAAARPADPDGGGLDPERDRPRPQAIRPSATPQPPAHSL